MPERHNPWQSATALLGIGTILESLWEQHFPELGDDSRTTHDYRRIIMLIYGGFVSNNLPTILRFKRVLEEQLQLSPNRVEHRLTVLLKLGLVEKIPDTQNHRQKRLRTSQDATKRMLRMGDELAQYARHTIELLTRRGQTPPSTQPTNGAFDPLPRFNGATLVN
jgi:DNA-binding MarR family transcriptional regulator